jgi:hypothetical protein
MVTISTNYIGHQVISVINVIINAKHAANTLPALPAMMAITMMPVGVIIAQMTVISVQAVRVAPAAKILTHWLIINAFVMEQQTVSHAIKLVGVRRVIIHINSSMVIVANAHRIVPSAIVNPSALNALLITF